MGELKQDLVEVEGLHLNQKQAYEYYRLYFSEHPEKLDTRQSPKAMIADEVIGEIVKEIAYNQKAEDQADDFIEKVWLLKEWLIKNEVCKSEQEG